MSRLNNGLKHTIRIPSDCRRIREVSGEILKLLEEVQPDESVLFDIRLCVEEMVRNAIVHGNKSDPSRQVTIDYWREEPGRFVVEIEDEGDGFDHKDVPDPTEDENLLKGSGRGIYITYRLMDEVKYTENGRRVRLVKRI